MALTYKKGILGQSTPGAASITTIYTSPTLRCASAALNVCNRNSSPTTIRVAIVSAGGSPVTTYLLYDETLPPAGQPGSWSEMRAVVLGPGESLQVYSQLASCDFTLTGVESADSMASFDA